MANRMHEKQRLSQNCSYLATPFFSTLTETSYLMAQLKPSRERKQKRRTREGENRVEKAHGKKSREGK